MKEIIPWVVTVNANQTYTICQCFKCEIKPWASADCKKSVSISKARKELMWLCSCGTSRDMPYCDGTHNPRNNMTIKGAIKDLWGDLKSHFTR